MESTDSKKDKSHSTNWASRKKTDSIRGIGLHRQSLRRQVCLMPPFYQPIAQPYHHTTQ